MQNAIGVRFDSIGTMRHNWWSLLLGHLPEGQGDGILRDAFLFT